MIFLVEMDIFLERRTADLPVDILLG